MIRKDVNMDTCDQTIYRHICENCGKEALLTSDEGFNCGWDYPPRMGAFKIVSPRTCGECPINTTLWWALTVGKIPTEQLNPKQLQTLERILNEPESILPMKE